MPAGLPARSFRPRLPITIPWCVSFLALLLTACVKTAPVVPPAPLKPSPQQAQRLADRGRYRESLREYRSIHEEFPEDKEILASYRATLEMILADAETAYLRDDCATAGKNYRILFESSPDFNAVASALPLDRPALRTKIDACVNRLTNQGLELYRKGDINSAIALWQGILTFDPDNIEIRKAIDNAATQQKTLEKAP